MRLNQYISSATGLSRRAADTEISSGHVTINGRVAVLGERVETDSVVVLSGQTVLPRAAHVYLALNKPTGYVSSRARQGSDPTIYKLLPPEYHNLKPAGRLDKDSRGLLLMSDNGHFIQHFTHPRGSKTKIYDLVLDRTLSQSAVDRLGSGVELDDGPSRLTVISWSGKKLSVSLTEGRNRQIRRTLGAIGYGITDLNRIQIGPFKLGSLGAGQWELIDGSTGE
jgi:23S rRNA pseudouridine2605 synthase